MLVIAVRDRTPAHVRPAVHRPAIPQISESAALRDAGRRLRDRPTHQTNRLHHSESGADAMLQRCNCEK